MRIAFVLLITLAACGGNKSTPANTSTTTSEKPADKPAGGGAQCCCALPSDPETYVMQDSTECHEDSHGVCQDDDSKCKK